MPNTKPSVGEALSLDEIEYEEWLSAEDATFYIQLELSVALTRDQVRAVAEKFKCTKGKKADALIQRGPIIEICRKLYFPDIPKGWKYIKVLSKVYKVNPVISNRWIEENKITAQKFNIGLEELWFAPEKEFRQYVIQQRNRKHQRGRIIGQKPFRRRYKVSRRNMASNGFNPS